MSLRIKIITELLEVEVVVYSLERNIKVTFSSLRAPAFIKSYNRVTRD